MPILFLVNCERAVLFSVKHDLDPPLYITLLKGLVNENYSWMVEMLNEKMLIS